MKSQENIILKNQIVGLDYLQLYLFNDSQNFRIENDLKNLLIKSHHLVDKKIKVLKGKFDLPKVAWFSSCSASPDTPYPRSPATIPCTLLHRCLKNDPGLTRISR